ncbi:MAG: hypothetical protein ACJ798_13985 [Phenylobacterium sp.]
MIVEESFWKQLAHHLCGPHPSEPPKSRRQQLEEACAHVRRQIEVQSASSPYRGMDNEARRDALVAELEELLARLEASLADLGSRDG